MSLYSDLEFIDEVDQADLLGICVLCSSYKSLMSLQATLITGVIMFSSLFDSHCALELMAFVLYSFIFYIIINGCCRHVVQFYNETKFKEAQLHQMCLLTVPMGKLEIVISARK